MSPAWFVGWMFSPLIGVAVVLLGWPGAGAVMTVCAGVVVYFLPAISAARRGHVATFGVTLVNVFLGWTLVGWIAAAVWAYLPGASQAQGGGWKTCPACAEQVRELARRCKHCGNDL